MDETVPFELGLSKDNIMSLSEHIVVITEAMASNGKYKPEEVPAAMFQALEYILGSCPDPWKRKELARRLSEPFGLEVSRAHKKLRNGKRWAGWA